MAPLSQSEVFRFAFARYALRRQIVDQGITPESAARSLFEGCEEYWAKQNGTTPPTWEGLPEKCRADWRDMARRVFAGSFAQELSLYEGQREQEKQQDHAGPEPSGDQ